MALKGAQLVVCCAPCFCVQKTTRQGKCICQEKADTEKHHSFRSPVQPCAEPGFYCPERLQATYNIGMNLLIKKLRNILDGQQTEGEEQFCLYLAPVLCEDGGFVHCRKRKNGIFLTPRKASEDRPKFKPKYDLKDREEWNAQFVEEFHRMCKKRARCNCIWPALQLSLTKATTGSAGGKRAYSEGKSRQNKSFSIE